MANEQNLITQAERPADERSRVGAAGGRASGAKRREQRRMRDLAASMLGSKAPERLARQVRAMAPDVDEVTVAAAMLAGQVGAAAKGNANAFRAVTELVERSEDEREAGAAEGPWACDLALHIGRDFVDLHRDIHAGRVTDAWLAGGRGSLKSSFASLEIAAGLMADPDANALVIQSRRTNIRDASMAQMLWAFDRLGVADLWVPTGSTLRINNRETGQAVVFRGCDEPRKIKSIKLRHGHWRYLWVEEADLLRGMAEARSVRQSVSRSGVRWLQQRTAIVVRPCCRIAAAELPAYAYALDAEGHPTATLPDADNHAIDALRYAVCNLLGDRRFV